MDKLLFTLIVERAHNIIDSYEAALSYDESDYALEALSEDLGYAVSVILEDVRRKRARAELEVSNEVKAAEWLAKLPAPPEAPKKAKPKPVRNPMDEINSYAMNPDNWGNDTPEIDNDYNEY